MNNSSSNIKFISQFFKNNHFKMIFFILITMFLSYVVNDQYYKNKKPYYYIVDITINENDGIWWPSARPGTDLLFFFETKEYNDLILNTLHGKSQNLGIKIFLTSKEDKNEYIKVMKTLNEFKNQTIKLSEANKNTIDQEVYDNLENNILQKMDIYKDLIIAEAYRELEEVNQKDAILKKYLNQNLIFYLNDFNEDKLQKTNNKAIQRLVITFILSIIFILIILWVKLFIRQIKINQ